MNFWIAIITLSVCMTMGLVGSLAFLKGKHHPEIRWFALFCLVYPGYTVVNTIQDDLYPHLVNPTETLLWYGELASYGTTLFGCLSILFFLLFSQQFLSRFVRVTQWPFAMLLGGFVCFLSLGTITLKPVGWISTLTKIPPFFPYYGTMLILTLLYILYLYIRAFSHVGPHKTAYRILGIGMVIFFLGVSVCDILLPIFGNYHWLWVGRLSGLILSIAMFIVITSFKLWDIRTAVHYTVYWILSVGLGVGLLCGSLYACAVLGILPMAHIQAIIGGSLCLLVCMLAYCKGIQPKIDHLLFRRHHALQQEIVVFQKQLATLTTVQSFLSTLAKLIQRVLYISHIAIGIPIKETGAWHFFVLTDTNDYKEWVSARPTDTTQDQLLEQWLSTHLHFTVAHVEWLRVQGNTLAGLLFLGENKRLKPLSSSERDFLGTLNPSIGIYLKNATLFDALKSKNHETTQLQQQLVGLQEAFLEALQDKTLTTGVIHEVKNTHLAMGSLIQHFLNRIEVDVSLVRQVLGEIGKQSAYLYLFSQNLLYTSYGRDIQLRLEKNVLFLLIENSLQTHSLLLRQNEVQVTLDIDKTAWVQGDRQRLQLVMSNLIHNAAKYGGRTLSVTGHQTEEGYLLASVSGHFPMPVPDIIPGIGLRICEKIIAQHQGSIAIEHTHTQVNVRVQL